MDTRPIGMFDSGVGGVTVLKEVTEEMKKENIVYLGDTKRFPYGSKSRESILDLTKKGMDFLIKKQVKAIVIACGTATSQALKEVQAIYPIPIIGIIDSTVQYIKAKPNLRRVGVIATTGTIRSKGWEENLTKEIPEVTVISKACPLLAPMAEEGWTDNEIARLTIREYVKEFKRNPIDCLILGCTHYPLFQSLIKEELGDTVEIINTGEMLSKDLAKILQKEGLANKEENAEPNYEIYLTDTETNFIHVAGKLLADEKKINQIKLANIN